MFPLKTTLLPKIVFGVFRAYELSSIIYKRFRVVIEQSLESERYTISFGKMGESGEEALSLWGKLGEFRGKVGE